MVGFASVPFNGDWGRKNPLKQGFMSLAGPMANLLLAAFALGAMRALLAAHVFQYSTDGSSLHYVEAIGAAARSPLGALATALSVMLKLNVVLFLFNLIPVPPLDGAGVLSGFFPKTFAPLYDKLSQVPAFEFLGLLLAWQVFPYFELPVFRVVLTWLYR
jgi:Zn-dependent protease